VKGPKSLVEAASRLREAAESLFFSPPVAQVYNPLVYAWEVHNRYLSEFGAAPKRVVFWGMNPGPWGMVQTGVPFGEVQAVRDWMKLRGPIGKPAAEHPRRPVEGFDCARSEVSGRRLWGLFRSRYDTARAFFQDHFVANYCPLVFMEKSGRNRTPDKLPAKERELLFRICDRHLRETVGLLRPEWVIGVGRFARLRIESSLAGSSFRIGEVLHPSPASPAANRGWAEQAARRLRELGIWE
jgi:single-strand selective monofunctional uracil DNA glycosylase